MRFWCLVGMMFAHGVSAGPLRQCPVEFPVQGMTLHAPDGWVAIAPPVLRLTSVAVILGPPQLPGAVQIGKRRKVRGGYDVVFDALYTTSSAPDDKWLACHYRDLVLAQRLPAETRQCVVEYRHQVAYSDELISIRCQ